MDKSKGHHYLLKDAVEDASVPSDMQTMNADDGNAVFYTMREIPRTFKEICRNVFGIITSGKSNVILSTDMYKKTSIKSLERSNRGCGERRICHGENPM